MVYLKKAIWIAILSCLFTTTVTFSQSLPNPPLITDVQSLTIDDLVNIALENQAYYQKAVQDENFATYAYRGVYGSFLPRARASVSYQNTRTEIDGYVFQGQVIPGAKEWSHRSNWDIGLSEDIFTGGSRYYGMKSAQLQLENINLYRIRTKDELTYSVREAVYFFLSAQRRLEVSNEILELRKESLRFAKARYENGDVIELDVLQAEIDLGNAENALLTAQQTVENTRENINLVIGARLESGFPINADLKPVLPAVKFESLVRFALDTRPDLKANRNIVEIEEQNIKIARAGYLPSASLNMGFSGSDGGELANRFQLFPGENTRYYGVGMSWNLFNQFQTDINRQQSVVNKRKAEWDSHLSEQQVNADIRRQVRNLTRLFDQTEVLDKNRDLARRQLELEQERYRLGASSQLNLRSAQVTFIEAENNHISTVLEFFTTLASLERDLGRPLGEVVQ
ncbi:MAG: TolC family protein [Candidatus Electryonea clarkiae]|nr:TolC family protein [Candidatus Electryonea clarkiae]MDP8287364.1 TolC family protein [Candidatus Electryonea clarkiae]